MHAPRELEGRTSSAFLFRKSRTAWQHLIPSKLLQLSRFFSLHPPVRAFMIHPSVYNTAERSAFVHRYFYMAGFPKCLPVTLLMSDRWSKAMSPSQGKCATPAWIPMMNLTCSLTIHKDATPICWIMPESSPYQHCVSEGERGEIK